MRIKPQTSQKIAKGLIWLAALFVLVVLIGIIIYILSMGLPHINWGFLTEAPRDAGRSGGIASTIVGTLFVAIIALVIHTVRHRHGVLLSGIYA